MTVLRDYYDAGDDNSAGTYRSTRWYAQTFATTLGYNIEGVVLKVFRFSTPGNITVSIKKTDVDGKPTGADLCTVTVDGDGFSESTDGVWTTFTFVTPYYLSADTTYAIVIKKSATTSGMWFYWRYDDNDATYSGGQVLYTDNGVLWNATPADDFMFRTYDAFVPPTDVVAYKRLVVAGNDEIWYEDI